MDAAGFPIGPGGAAPASLPDGARLAEFGEYHEFLAALRQRAATLEISMETVDQIAGLTPRFAQKVIGPAANRPLARGNFDYILGALSCRLILVHDARAFDRLSTRYVHRNERKVRVPVTVVFTGRTFQKIGRLGAAARAQKLSPERRSEISRQAALARWGKMSAAERRAHARRLRARRGKHNPGAVHADP